MSVLLLTGTTGIAEATARLARERGHDTFCVGLEGGDYACDLRFEADDAVKAALHRFGRIDALFNVAGASGRSHGDGPLHECSDEGWHYTMGANLLPVFKVSRALLRVWVESKQPGSIVNLTSVLAFSPQADLFHTHAYAASKGAIISMTKAMAAYYAPHGIRVNALAPGLVATPMSARAQSSEGVLHFVERKQPLSRGILDAGEVAKAALFLMTDDSRHVTGQVLAVDGGWCVS